MARFTAAGLYLVTSQSRSAGRSTLEVLAAALAGSSAELSKFYLDYGVRPESIPRISYLDALTGRFDPELVQGKQVILGATAIELGDQVAVPLSGALPGPVLRARSAIPIRTLIEGHSLPSCLALTESKTGQIAIARSGGQWVGSQLSGGGEWKNRLGAQSCRRTRWRGHV